MANDKSKPASAARSEAKHDSRDALLAAAKSIFAQRGYEGATVKDLADAAHVNVSLVSYHFGGKEGLFRACLEDFGRGRLDAAERMLKPASNQTEFEFRLRLFAEEFFETQLRERDVCTIIHRDFDGGHPIVLDVFREVFVKVFDRFHGFIVEGQKAGFLRADLDTDPTASLLFGGLVHLMRSDPFRRSMTGDSLEDPAYRARVANAFATNACRGLATKDGSKK